MKKINYFLYLGLLAFLLPASIAWAKNSSPPNDEQNSGQTEIHVTLLGRPCLLQGPSQFDAQALKTLHSIGPDQMPNLSEWDPQSSPEVIKKAIEKIRNSRTVPALAKERYPRLEKYRSKLEKRLEAHQSIAIGFESEKKSHNLNLIYSAGKAFLQEQDYKNFEIHLKKIELLKKSNLSQEQITEIFNLFDTGIEQDPQEIFHAAIDGMKIQYTCSFEEEGNENEN